VGLVHVAHLDLILLASGPLALALILPIASTYVLRLVIAVGVYYCSNFVGAWLLGLVGIPFTPPLAALWVLLPVAVGVSIGRLQPRIGPLLDWGDALALGTGGVLLALLWLPSRRDDSATILGRLISGGEDNAGHLGIVEAMVIQHGLIFGQIQKWSGQLLAGHTAYPPGFHINVALAVSAVENWFGKADPRHLVRVYFYAQILLEAVWATTTVMAIRALGAVRGSSPLALSVVALAVVLFFLFGPPLDLMLHGFQPHAASLWMLVFQVFVAATPELDDRPLLRFSLALVGLVGSVWSWYLVAPVTGVAVSTVAWLNRDQLTRRWRMSLAVAGVAAFLCLPPLYYAASTGAQGYINAGGGVYFLDRFFLAVLVVAALCTVFLPAALPGRRGRIVVVVSLMAAILAALALREYQVRTVGSGKYFYEKVLYTVAIAAALGAGALGLLIGYASAAVGKLPLWKRTGLALGCGALVYLSTGVVTATNPGRLYLTGTQVFADVGALKHVLATAPPPDQKQVLFWGDGDHTILVYLGARFAAAIYMRNDDPRNNFMAYSAPSQNDRELLQLLRETPAGLRLLTRNPHLRERLVASGFTPADMQKVVIDTITEPAGGAPAAPHRSYDISAPALLPGLFRQR
jgi:hypothetical protein